MIDAVYANYSYSIYLAELFEFLYVLRRTWNYSDSFIFYFTVIVT